MAQIDVPLARSGFGQTRRADNWWVQPLVVFSRIIDFHRLFHLGGLAGRALPVRALSFAVLLAGIVRPSMTPGSAQTRPGCRCGLRRRC